MVVHLDNITNNSTRGSNVLVERGDGTTVRVDRGGSTNASWVVPTWNTGHRMIVNNNGPRIWVVDRDSWMLVSHDEGRTWSKAHQLAHGNHYNMVIGDNGVNFN
ncbi:unnamed protein product [Adineta steineri]|uniref:Uncharacterized protein n=1 Tax=Adineta steineri TaxID=433720 RepID=A0A814VN35_9BILA|nr:unnamed protein product [Adineta steineri]